MVSALWKACSEGDVEKVAEHLNDASSVDIEIRDHNGVTPLIEAVKNGHIEIVRVLLDRGADPTSGSSQGPPEFYTSDPAILEMLSAARNKMIANAIPNDGQGYVHDLNVDPTKGYYGPPPGAYYYPSMPPPMMPDGSMAYYPPPPPPPHGEHIPSGLPNLPPPEVARMIPCRYFPACRYGTSCMFAHPPSAYIQGPLPPPAQYPAPYDSIPASYPPTYYPVPPQSFQSPMSPLGSSAPHMVHTRSGSEVISPSQGPFSPPPMPYGVLSPMSPSYAHPGQIPVPMTLSDLPPPQHPGGPQSPPQTMYNIPPAGAGPMPPYGVPQDAMGQPIQGMPLVGAVPEMINSPNSSTVHPRADGYAPLPHSRDAGNHHRKGSARRPSLGGYGRKPPCLFFPAGRCRNGDDCRFPHVLPDGPAPQHVPHASTRGGFRPRGGPAPVNVNGSTVIEEKLASMSIQDNGLPQIQSRSLPNGTGTGNSSRSQSTDASKGRHQNGKPHFPPGARPDKRPANFKPQRVPNADEFPVLAGSSTPPMRSPPLNGLAASGYAGPTAAQVLQAPPPPARKDSQPATRGSSPEQGQEVPKDSESVTPSAPVEPTPNKLPVSFAAVATPDAVKEVSVLA